VALADEQVPLEQLAGDPGSAVSEPQA
jgi:hypothetical protein